MDVEQQQQQVGEVRYVDWKSRPAVKGYHGGVLAAYIVLVVEILENLAYLANASNLVIYLSKYMHFSLSNSANTVTTFMGTAFLLALLGGFLSDAYLTTYNIFLLSAFVEFTGLLILTAQARNPSLRPSNSTTSGSTAASGKHKAILFIGLYLVALGAGGIKGSLPPHGAEQFDEEVELGRKHRSTFFNYYIFCLSCGGLIAVTFVVWIEDNIGWEWGFGVSTVSILIAVAVFLLGSAKYQIKVADGSPITTILKVLVASVFHKLLCSWNPPKNADILETRMSLTELNSSPKAATTNHNIVNTADNETPFQFLDRATMIKKNQTQECSTKQVEETKFICKTIPIFASTIMLNCCLAQLSTFSVQQASTMNTYLGSFKVPPASLPVFPVIFTMILTPIYNQIILPLARKLITRTETGITHLQRIGTGLVLSIIAMAVAALVETKRKHLAIEFGDKPVPLTFLWISLQYLFLGAADMLSLPGLMEFFFTEAPRNLRSLATSLSWASLALGYYFSSVLVSIVNTVTGVAQGEPWLKGSDLNHYRLERFYWLMCGLSGLSFLHYLFWACRYQYRSNIHDRCFT